MDGMLEIDERVFEKLYIFFLGYSTKTQNCTSFLKGDTGALCLLAIHNYELKHFDETALVNGFITSCRNINKFENCSILTGLAGYLLSLQIMCHHTYRKLINIQKFDQVLIN
ncbi:hypothetical protein RF11_03444 [Thelohanellus kitauei]|uniref:Uncharacterized protein n=1 Tax=Thelohanellus kitauei TaxID=669202 RepID=A0A0C2MHV8_THEKT|nr:hypothetical protein RF11_03444 [Thelohanellus kitauei]